MKRIAFLAFVVLALPATANAQPACGDHLTTSTTLTADLHCEGQQGLTIASESNGIVLDLGGHSLTGAGISVGRADNAVVRNGTISDSDGGVSAGNSTARFERLTITRTHQGMALFHGIYVIERCRIERNDIGLYVDPTADVTLIHTKVKHNGS